jgi:hypothetical protein
MIESAIKAKAIEVCVHNTYLIPSSAFATTPSMQQTQHIFLASGCTSRGSMVLLNGAGAAADDDDGHRGSRTENTSPTTTVTVKPSRPETANGVTLNAVEV